MLRKCKVGTKHVKLYGNPRGKFCHNPFFLRNEKDVIDEVNTFQRHTANSYMVSQIHEANH